MLQDWIDLDAIADLAKQRPNWSFVLIGPSGPGVDLTSLKQLANIHLLGKRDHEDLPQYLKGFDLCLNPFKLNRLTTNVSPLKFYEYLASGKPIVTITLPELEQFSSQVEIANDPSEYLTKIETALANETPERQQARLACAGQHTWEARVADMMKWIVPKLQG
jgi:glycosyltransferase involved in cell wall biosynthesis